MIIQAGSTDKSVPFYFADDAGGTNPGEPTTGLLFSDIETGGSASYQRQGAARVDFTLVTLASASAAHSDGGFILVDDTEMPGVYRLDIPDAAIAAGVDYVIIYLRAAAAKNTICRPLKIELSPPVNAAQLGGAPVTATTSVTFPAASTVATTTGAVGSVTGAVGSVTGSVGSVTGAVGSVTAGVTLAAGAITDASLAGNMEIVFETDFATNYNTTRNAWATNVQDFVGTTAADPFAGQVVAASVTGSVGSITGVTFPTNFSDLAIELTTGYVSSNVVEWIGVTVTDPLLTETNIADQVWDEVLSGHVTAGTAGKIVSDIIVDTADLQTQIGVAGAGLTTIPWSSAWDAEVQSEVADALAAYNAVATTDLPANFSGLGITAGAIDNVTLVATTTTNTDMLTAAAVNAEVDTALSDIHLDHLLAVDYDPAAKPGVATALLNELVESDAGVSRYTAAALAQAPTGAGGDGSAFTAIPWNAAWDAEVQSECADALTAYAPNTVVPDAAGTANTLIGANGANLTEVSLTTAEKTSIADAILTRDWTAVAGEASRSVLNALRFLRNKWSLSGTTLTVTEEDDTTSAWTATVTTDAAADPVNSVDPT